MKKTIISLAVAAGMAASMAAQAEVTVSGQLQAEVVSVSGDAANANGIYLQDGSTYGKQNSSTAGGLFITATEDLGDGLKAIAKYGFSVLTDSGITTRDAYVGLNGGFGTVLAGRMGSPYKTSTASWDPFLATFMQARGNGGASDGPLGHGSYLDNVVAYSNKFGIAKVVAAVSFDEAKDTTAVDDTYGNHAMIFSVNVPVGPMEIAFAYLDASDKGSATSVDATEMKIGFMYNVGATKVALQYEDRDAGLQAGSLDGIGLGAGIPTVDLDAAKADADGETFTLLTVSQAMGSNTISASFGQNSMSFKSGDDFDTTYMAIGVKHAFSKSTSVHAGYRVTSPDTDVDADEKVMGVGMRVKF